MKRLTKMQRKLLHIELWNWLADNPHQSKFCWPRWKEIKTIHNEMRGSWCFLCADWSCTKCPIQWEAETCMIDTSLYRRYGRAEGLNNTLLARKIATTWKKGMAPRERR